jgi:N-terminal domain of anti-restriction factor ArdC
LRHNGIPYKGINVVMLWSAAVTKGYACPLWLTFKQAIELGGHVRKGEAGELVVYANSITRTETDAKGEETEREIPYMKGPPHRRPGFPPWPCHASSRSTAAAICGATWLRFAAPRRRPPASSTRRSATASRTCSPCWSGAVETLPPVPVSRSKPLPIFTSA